MKKSLLAVSALGLFFVSANVYATCHDANCVDANSSETSLYVYAVGDTVGHGDKVMTRSDGLVVANVNKEDAQFSGLAGWSTKNDGTGDKGSGGEAGIAYEHSKTDTWGVDGVKISGGDCGGGCGKEYFDTTTVSANAATFALGYGKESRAVTAGFMAGNETMGDPADGNVFNYANVWDTESKGPGFQATSGTAFAGAELMKKDFSARFKVPAN